MNILRVVARPLLASYFVYNGVDAIRNSDVHAQKLQQLLTNAEKAGVPPLLTTDAKLLSVVSGVACTTAGAAFALGFWPRTNAIVLGALALPAAVLNNPITTCDEDSEDTCDWQKTIAAASILGGLLIASADREGRPSAKWLRKNRHVVQHHGLRSARKSQRRRRRG